MPWMIEGLDGFAVGWLVKCPDWSLKLNAPFTLESKYNTNERIVSGI